MTESHHKPFKHFHLVLLIGLFGIKFIFASNENSSDVIVQKKQANYKYLISGGTKGGPNVEYVKYLISLRTRRPQKFFGDNHFCSGIIIGRKKILTAAHCVMDRRKVMTRPRHLLVVAGTPNRLHVDKTTLRMLVHSVIPHENYIRNSTNDIAIVTLEKNLPTNSAGIAIMPLPKQLPVFETMCFVIGWGRMYFNGPLSAEIIHLDVKLLTMADCKTMIPIFDIGSSYCAGDPNNRFQDSCRGDSGGPLICNGELTAVTSWTLGCSSHKVPSLYEGVFNHIKWIEANKAKSITIGFTPYILFICICLNIFDYILIN